MRHRLSNIAEQSRLATCEVCGPVKIYRKHGSPALWRCAVKSRTYTMRYEHGKRATLKSMCEICKATTKLCYDHCHTSGKFRGTLCRSCNLAIGFLKDSPRLCRQAAKYLSK